MIDYLFVINNNTLKKKDQPIDLDGRLSGEIVYTNNPSNFWVRFDCQKCEYMKMQAQLQSEYALEE